MFAWIDSWSLIEHKQQTKSEKKKLAIQSDLLGTLSKAKLPPYRKEKVTLNHLDRQVLFEWSETGHKRGGFNSASSALMKGKAWPQEWEKEQSNNNDIAISPKGAEKVKMKPNSLNLDVPWSKISSIFDSANVWNWAIQTVVKLFRGPDIGVCGPQPIWMYIPVN